MNRRAGALLTLSAALCWSDSLPEALQSRRFQDAVNLADSLLETQPRDPRIWTARGVALDHLGREQESLASFEKALGIDSYFLPALKAAAEVSYRLHDPRASGFLDRLIGADPANSVAHAMAGVLAFEASRCDAAVPHFQKARAETAGNPQASRMYATCLNLLASTEAAAGNVEGAVAHLRHAIETAPRDERNYVDLAALCISGGSPESAASVVETGLRHLPDSARLHALRGVVKGQLGAFEEAANEFELANRLDPQQEYGAAGLGVLYTEENRIDLASGVLRQRLKKSPDDPTLNFLFADTLIHEDVQRDTPGFIEARDALIRAVRVKPDFAKAHTLLGKLYNRVGDYSRAVEELRYAVKYNPSDRMALSQLAIALRKLGRTEEAASAIDSLRRLVIRNP